MVADKLQSLFSDRDDVFRLCFLGNDVDAFAPGGIVHDVFPMQCKHVTDAKTCQAGKERCRFQYGLFAGRFSQFVE